MHWFESYFNIEAMETVEVDKYLWWKFYLQMDNLNDVFFCRVS